MINMKLIKDIRPLLARPELAITIAKIVVVMTDSGKLTAEGVKYLQERSLKAFRMMAKSKLSVREMLDTLRWAAKLSMTEAGHEKLLSLMRKYGPP